MGVQERMLRGQDEQLRSIGDTMGSLLTVSRQIGIEIDEQAEMLDDLNTELENTDSKLDSTIKKVAKVLHMNNDRRQWLAILVLVGLLVWMLKEDRVAVIALHRCGYTPIQIFDILKNLNITKRFVYRTIKRYNEDSSVDDRSRSGRPRSVRTPAVIKAEKARIQRNPKRKQKLLALQMGLSRTTGKRVLNADLKFRAYRRKTGHRLNARLMDLRLKRCRALLKRYAGKKYREVLFSVEIFLP
ncbi:unnamed protein product [Chilo suppressalis]|uniref:t-SNARE coiled-coil homology domain-containing protein n=1 Tax=Chilo suppressalis TaxID=168631 RepID=A0ABN8B0Z1_CHISP|nr:unnamed protein product [Chilo suppressalis]